MPYRFLHIGFAFNGVPRVKDMEAPMGQLGDWVRYSALSWLLWTEKEPAAVFWSLRAHVNHDDQLLVVPIDLTSSIGHLSPWIWTWINNKTTVPSVTTFDTPQLPPR